MSAVGLVGIKRRIKSVNNTKKITNAMGLVATSKLRKAREALTKNESYYDCLEEIKTKILNNIDCSSDYLKNNDNGKKLYLVVTSDLGLCGSYNLNVVTETLRNMKNNSNKSILVVLGGKGKIYFSKYGITPDKVESIPDIPDMNTIESITSYVLDKFNSGEVSSIDIVYTHFTSTVKQEVKVETLLPLQHTKSKDDNEFFDFEPDANLMVNEIIGLYLNEKILNITLNSKACENAARMNAMNGATKNANDLLDKLNTKYNRIRQSSITEEISEIVGGAEAQK